MWHRTVALLTCDGSRTEQNLSVTHLNHHDSHVKHQNRAEQMKIGEKSAADTLETHQEESFLFFKFNLEMSGAGDEEGESKGRTNTFDRNRFLIPEYFVIISGYSPQQTTS